MQGLGQPQPGVLPSGTVVPGIHILECLTLCSRPLVWVGDCPVAPSPGLPRLLEGLWQEESWSHCVHCCVATSTVGLTGTAWGSLPHLP